MTETILATPQKRRKASSSTPDPSDDTINETRIEISWDPTLPSPEKASCMDQRQTDARNLSSRRRVVDSATDIPEPYPHKAAPETVRVRDLNTENVKIFTPVTMSMTQRAQPLSSDSVERRPGHESAAGDDAFVLLSELYESDGEAKHVDCGCAVLDPSEILCGRRLIGHGASSQVYKGWYRGEEVVLKFIICSKEGNFEKEFRRECAIFQKIPRHDNIIKMYGVVGTCLVLEYCSLGSLFDLIHDPQYPLPLVKVKEMLHDIASSLQHLHSRRMIHRDLKPGNLLVTRTAARDVVKLADFGLARNYLKNATMTVGMGTWQYSSPEFFTNSKLTSKSDVYSFGVVLWEMCTRRQPYGDAHFRQIYENVLKGQDYALPAPQEMDSFLTSLYCKCTASDPDSRPSFSEILTDIQTDMRSRNG